MATEDDVRRIVATLPETSIDVNPSGQMFAAVRKKSICWTWLERTEPKRRRVPQPEVLGVRVTGEEEKQELIAADPEKFFTEDHYNGFPAILVRLAAVGVDELTELLNDAWRIQAPKRLLTERDGPKSTP
ncbi:MAG TPA: MmcQ/YjbR family DNA-binding protein [Nocardioidaceae bacterium]|nr:MmcQ/YjbR family DNA-binding protein [Nocardioidaceae bacterium]